ncbi:uncharacterized protein [Dendropsophus ebraccatus]|uniref:uncharacterized protein n=1 Tax=Dendropsophus ebraccatus TaxID=150705 RepID=UPI0038314BC6
METQPLLGSQGAQQNAGFWVSVRRGLLILFWASFVGVTIFAIFLLVQAYEPPPHNVWHQRRVICRHEGRTDVTPRIQEASALGCGGLIFTQEEVNTPGLTALVAEGKRYGVRIILEVPILVEYNGRQLQRLKEEARSWMEDGASGFLLLGGQRATVQMVSQMLQDGVETVSGEERLILLPDWLCEDVETPRNKSHLLRTCPLPDWNLQNATVGAEIKDVAWEVESGDTNALRQFLALTLPGTIILSLNQSVPPPSWLRSLLLIRFQNPALYTGWLQLTSNGSSYSALLSWGCSTLLVAISHSDQSHNVSLHLPHFSASAKLLLSTVRGRNQGQVLQDIVQLAAGEAQLLRLTPV